MLEGILVFLTSSDPMTICSAPPRADKILLDIEVDEIAHADRRHQQNFDRDGHLSPHRPRWEFRCRWAWRINSCGSASNAKTFSGSLKCRNRVILVSVSPRRLGERRPMMAPIRCK